MTNENETSNATNVKQPFEIKKRTLPIVLLLVVIPWFLLALPGYVVSVASKDEDSTKSECTFRNFGWPLTHKENIHVDVVGRWRGGQFRPGESLAPDKLNVLIEKYVAERPAPSMLNLIPKAAAGQSLASLWTDTRNYPTEMRKYIEDNVIEKGMKQTWNIPMLIGNIVMMLFASIFVGYLVEKFSK